MYICIPNQNIMKIEKVKFQYKGDDKRESPVRNHPGVNALALSLERGKALLANGTKLIADSKKLLA